MPEFRCGYCGTWLKSQDEYNLHKIEAHNLFKNNDENITEETIAKFRTVMARVKWLMEHCPTTRGEDRILVLQYLKIFEKHLCYNEATHRIELRKREGLTYTEWLEITSFDTISRAGRKIREQFPDLQPSDATIAKRRQRQKAIRENIKTLALNKKEYDDIEGRW